MDEKQLMDMLSTVKAPSPSENGKNQALNAALAAFDKNNAAGAQAPGKADRLTDIGSTNYVRRFLMQKRYVLSGVGGAVALTAIFAVLGTPFIMREMSDVSVNRSSVATGSTTSETVGSEVNDPEYIKKQTEANKKAAVQAQATGQSNIPVPIAPAENQTLSLPATPSAPQGDPLAEWRAKGEAKRVKTEQLQAPLEEKEMAAGKNEPMSPPMVQDLAKSKDDLDARMTADTAAPSSSVPAMKKMPAPAVAGQMQEAQRQQGPAAANAVGGAAAVRADKASVMPMQQSQIVASPAPSDYYARNGYHDEGRDEFPNFEDNAVTEVATAPVSTFSIDVDTSSYSLIRRMINGGQLPPKGAVRLEELINYFPYSYDLPEKGADPFKPTIAVYSCPWKEGDKLVHIGIKGYDLATRPKSNIVFLIDTSGSMDEPDKLPLLISSFKLMLDSLKPDDKISIVTYAGNAGIALQPTNASEKSKIVSILDHLQAGGSTAGAEGIRTAYELAAQNLIKDGNNRVILATDGDFNVGISDQSELKTFIEKKRDQGIYLSTMGFGMGNYHDDTMQTLAQNGNGNAAYIDNLNEARKVLVEEAGSTLFAIAKDVKIQVEFNPAQVQEYRLLGYETRHLNREDFNNDKIDAGEIGAGHSVTAIYEVTPVGGTPIVDNLRYAPKAAEDKKVEEADKTQFSNELAFLKIRYKRPDENTSILMTRPITSSDERKFNDLPDDLRFAAAVAGFGQLLRGSKYTNSLTWDQVIDMANSARGKDEFGYRTEFVNLVRLAKSEAGAGQAAPSAPVRGRE